jgi:hypothetical protein
MLLVELNTHALRPAQARPGASAAAAAAMGSCWGGGGAARAEALLQAAARGDAVAVRKALEAGATAEARDEAVRAAHAARRRAATTRCVRRARAHLLWGAV